MNIVVIGGGVTGCITALEMRERGHEVTLHEQSGLLGGSLRDIVIGKSSFFNGCQYLNANTPWVKKVKQFPEIDLIDFPLEYGSCTHFGAELEFHHEYAHPSFSRPLAEGHHFKSIDGSLKQRLENYPDLEKQALNAWVDRFGVPTTELHHSTVTSLQIGRIYFKGGDSAIRNLKQKKPAGRSAIGVTTFSNAVGRNEGNRVFAGSGL